MVSICNLLIFLNRRLWSTYISTYFLNRVLTLMAINGLHMDNVIGYNGTSEDRLKYWRTMLLLKESIKGDKDLSNSNLKNTIDNKNKVLQYVFNNYIRKVS